MNKVERISELVLVATPIGNLEDLSPRAIKTLTEADVVACEDTRRTGRLFQSVGIKKRKLLRVDAHKEDQVVNQILNFLHDGLSVAMVSDAGTPGISDPGQRLVSQVAQAGYKVSVVPGPSAPIAALVVSGLPTDRWCMEGFLPRKGVAREERLIQIAVEERTTVVFETAQRLETTLREMLEVFGGNRYVVIVRELTKIYEEVWRGTLAEASVNYEQRPKGELVLVIEGSSSVAEISDSRVQAMLVDICSTGVSTRDAAVEVASLLGVSKSHAYRLALKIKNA